MAEPASAELGHLCDLAPPDCDPIARCLDAARRGPSLPTSRRSTYWGWARLGASSWSCTSPRVVRRARRACRARTPHSGRTWPPTPHAHARPRTPTHAHARPRTPTHTQAAAFPTATTVTVANAIPTGCRDCHPDCHTLTAIRVAAAVGCAQTRTPSSACSSRRSWRCARRST